AVRPEEPDGSMSLSTQVAATARCPARPGRRRALWVAGLLAAAIGLAGAAPAHAARQQTPAQKEAELRKLNERIEKVRKSVNADVQKRDKLSVELREAELGVAAARRELDDIRAQRLVAEGRLRELEQEQARGERELDGQRAELAGELRTAYANGREEQLKLLLNQEDPASFGRMLAYYGYFGRARAGRIRTIQDRLEHLALVGEKIAAEKSRLEALEQQREQRVASLKSSQEQRARAVSAIERQIKNRGGELTRMRSQARSLEKLIAQLREAIEKSEREAAAASRSGVARRAPFEPLKGKLPWPVQDGKVLARFGQSRAGGSLRWQGMLIGTDRGARVRAPYGGRVVYGDWLPGMGLMLVLDHGGGYMSLYGHNEELFRKVGDAVAAGDVIGSVGDSGGHSQPALYFEVRRGRTPVDPQIWLTRK
ncbi:MAG TPA: peptidoglycan DD-metalloendopeptidase family protein, partial [Steroidobacteraceae bacterium]|nr:peptidoglycan DD-metalloendopeptidase family protein [Steroidobacteraceae bacterium]